MSGVIGFFDWVLPENRVMLNPPTFTVADNSTGGGVVASGSVVADLMKEDLSKPYIREGLSNVGSPQLFHIDITMTATGGTETEVIYGAIGAIGVKVMDVTGTMAIDAKVTITVDPNSGSHGAGATYSQVVYLSEATALGAASFPSKNAVVFPFTNTPDVAQAGGKSGSTVNKVRITIQPVGDSGVTTFYDVHLSRIVIARCFYADVGHQSLSYPSEDNSVKNYADSGIPFVRRKNIKRRAAGQFVGLNKHNIFGAYGSEKWYPTTIAVNGSAGASRNVIFSPMLTPPSDELDGGAFQPAWGNEHIFGMLDRPLVPIMQTVLSDEKKQSWICEFMITETPTP